MLRGGTGGQKVHAERGKTGKNEGKNQTGLLTGSKSSSLARGPSHTRKSWGAYKRGKGKKASEKGPMRRTCRFKTEPTIGKRDVRPLRRGKYIAAGGPLFTKHQENVHRVGRGRYLAKKGVWGCSEGEEGLRS